MAFESEGKDNNNDTKIISINKGCISNSKYMDTVLNPLGVRKEMKRLGLVPKLLGGHFTVNQNLSFMLVPCLSLHTLPGKEIICFPTLSFAIHISHIYHKHIT